MSGFFGALFGSKPLDPPNTNIPAPSPVPTPEPAPAPVVSKDETPWMVLMYSPEWYGQAEVTGQKATAFDVMIFSHTDYGSLNGIEDEGCAATACAVLEISGYKSPHSALAFSFKPYGMASELKYGAVCVFQWSTGGHHVSFFVRDNGDGTGEFLGGNQGHMLQESTFPLSAIVSTRWPVKA